MRRRDAYCPFLNHRDARCGDNFNLQHTELAFDLCFGRPSRCPVYRELRAEQFAVGKLSAHDIEEPYHAVDAAAYVQVTVAGRHAQRIAAAA